MNRVRPWSLRTRLTLHTAIAIAVLVSAFAAGTVLEVGFHLVAVARGNARSTADQVVAVALKASRGARLTRVAAHRMRQAVVDYLSDFTNPEDPRLWWVSPAGNLHSPNTRKAAPPARRSGLLWAEAVWESVRPVPGVPGTYVAVEWAVDAELLRHLVEVLALGVVVTSLVGAAVGRWATRRVLSPVDQMTAAAQAMLSEGAPLALPELTGAADEFTRLAQVLRRLVDNLEMRRLRERRLLAEAAHQLRTPLAIVQGNLHLIRNWQGRDPEVVADSLAAAERVTEQMNHLLADLLTLELAEGGAEVPKVPVDLTEAVREVAEDARALSPQLTIDAPPPGAPEVYAQADPEGLRRALWALVENAIRYTPAGGRVELSVFSEPGWVALSVEDSGPGIRPEERQAVWERFYRGESARQQPGTGLGLPIARALVQQQNGRIEWEEARRLGGTRVVIRLPAPREGTARP